MDLSSGVKVTGSKYKTVSQKPTERFTTGQAADMMLSGAGFNNSGGPALSNHPGNITSDGTRFLLADRSNDRALIWNSFPAKNALFSSHLDKNKDITEWGIYDATIFSGWRFYCNALWIPIPFYLSSSN